MFLQNYAGMRYDTINIPLAADSMQTKINFPDQPNLRDAMIYGVEFVYTKFTFYGQPVINYDGTNQITNAYITLYFDGADAVHQIPMCEIAPIISGGGISQVGGSINGILGVNPKRIIWTKSYITLSAPAAPENNTNFVIGVFFKR